MIVCLCRHGEAVEGSEQLHDELRYLTAAGRSESASVGRVLRDQGEVPDLILTSPLVRAVQTASELAHALGYDRAIEVLTELAPGGQLDDVLAELGTLHPEQRLFLVGHEPQMSTWTAQLIGRPMVSRAFHKSGVARISWEGSPSRGTGEPGFYLSPVQLKTGPL